MIRWNDYSPTAHWGTPRQKVRPDVDPVISLLLCSNQNQENPMPSMFKGSATYRRFRLVGEPPADFRGGFTGSILKHAFQPLSPDDPDRERSAGWVNIHDALDTELTAEKLFFGEQLLFALRVDQKRVPAQILKARIQQAEKAYLEKQGKYALSRSERHAIRDQVRLQLLREVLPTMTTYDVAVDLVERQVRFWSLTKGVCEEFMELFETTFKLGLLPLGAYGLATCVLPPSDLDRFDAIQPSVFARPRQAQESRR